MEMYNRDRLPDGAFTYVGKTDGEFIRAYPITDHAHALRSLIGLNQWVRHQEEHCPLFIDWAEVEGIRSKIQAALDKE